MSEITDTFAEDHAAGLHQEEIVEILDKIYPCLIGHSRAISIIALTRMIAVMLGPTKKETRDEYLEAVPTTIANILKEMDRMMEELHD